MKKCFTFFSCFLLILNIHSFGQEKVVVEQIQTYSGVNPNASYWHLPTNIDFILKALDSGLFANLQLERVNSLPPIKKELTKTSNLGKITIDWTKSSAYNYHAYLEIYELTPAFIYQNKWVTLTQSKQDSIHTIWYIACNIYNQKQEKIFGKVTLIAIMPVHSLGMGYEVITTGSVPSNIYQAIAKGIGFITPEMENIEFMEAKMPSAYATDNYWMPLIHKQPRILFDTTKQFMSYSINGKLQSLRTPEAVLNKINLKDKSINNPFKELIALIRNTRNGVNYKEYYQVIQPLRDVIDNIDYTIEAYLEFDKDPIVTDNFKKTGIEFLQDSIHNIYQDRKKIGTFKVKENVVAPNKFYSPDKIYNGYDSSVSFALGTFYAKQPIVDAKVIDGEVIGHTFSIKLNYENNLKTISLDNKIIMVVEGNKKPFQMVLLDKTIPNTTMNLLLLIAFSEIFQSPL